MSGSNPARLRCPGHHDMGHLDKTMPRVGCSQVIRSDENDDPAEQLQCVSLCRVDSHLCRIGVIGSLIFERDAAVRYAISNMTYELPIFTR